MLQPKNESETKNQKLEEFLLSELTTRGFKDKKYLLAYLLKKFEKGFKKLSKVTEISTMSGGIILPAWKDTKNLLNWFTEDGKHDCMVHNDKSEKRKLIGYGNTRESVCVSRNLEDFNALGFSEKSKQIPGKRLKLKEIRIKIFKGLETKHEIPSYKEVIPSLIGKLADLAIPQNRLAQLVFASKPAYEHHYVCVTQADNGEYMLAKCFPVFETRHEHGGHLNRHGHYINRYTTTETHNGGIILFDMGTSIYPTSQLEILIPEKAYRKLEKNHPYLLKKIIPGGNKTNN